jgi:hypothetical protein
VLTRSLQLYIICAYLARYDFARSIIDQIFGPKTHKLFPKKTRLDGGGCRGKGFYPSKLDTGDPDIEYENDGVDIVIDEDSDVSCVNNYYTQDPYNVPTKLSMHLSKGTQTYSWTVTYIYTDIF